MNYIDVTWYTPDPEYPIRLVSELDENGFETRKLEYFRNGRVGFAVATASAHGCVLGKMAVPPLSQINADGEFTGVAISKDVFEQLWAIRFVAKQG